LGIGNAAPPAGIYDFVEVAGRFEVVEGTAFLDAEADYDGVIDFGDYVGDDNGVVVYFEKEGAESDGDHFREG
jgi:hypothetical protein